jgi:histidine triad (HIT) family protein
MMEDCIFCKIVNNELPRKVIFEDNDFLVFPSNQPVADIHWIIVPKKHLQTFLDIDNEILSMTKIAQKLIKEKGLTDAYRLCINGGKYQEVQHVHLHLLAGEIQSYT